jgi:hypothetical protein
MPIGNRTEVQFTFTEPLHGVVAVSQVGAKMKKFMAIYMAFGADFENMMKNSTPEQRNKGMEAWMKWMNDNKSSILESGAPKGKTKRADAIGAQIRRTTSATLSCKQKRTTRSETVQQGSPTSSNVRCMGRNSRNYAAAADVR